MIFIAISCFLAGALLTPTPSEVLSNPKYEGHVHCIYKEKVGRRCYELRRIM